MKRGGSKPQSKPLYLSLCCVVMSKSLFCLTLVPEYTSDRIVLILAYNWCNCLELDPISEEETTVQSARGQITLRFCPALALFPGFICSLKFPEVKSNFFLDCVTHSDSRNHVARKSPLRAAHRWHRALRSAVSCSIIG